MSKPNIILLVISSRLARPRLVSVSEYAAAHWITPQAVRKAIGEGRIKAKKIGKQWVIDLKKGGTREKRIGIRISG